MFEGRGFAVLAMAVFALVVVIAAVIWRGDLYLRQQHRDVQEVIQGQRAILKQFEEQQAQINKLTRELSERCDQIEKRLHRLEGA